MHGITNLKFFRERGSHTRSRRSEKKSSDHACPSRPSRLSRTFPLPSMASFSRVLLRSQLTTTVAGRVLPRASTPALARAGLAVSATSSTAFCSSASTTPSTATSTLISRLPARRFYSETPKSKSSSGTPPPPPPPPPTGPKQSVKFWPFFIIIGLGTGGYIMLANRRKGASFLRVLSVRRVLPLTL